MRKTRRIEDMQHEKNSTQMSKFTVRLVFDATLFSLLCISSRVVTLLVVVRSTLELRKRQDISILHRCEVFTYYDSSGGVYTTKFLQCCNSIWIKLGYPQTTGHSFRIGGTTEFLAGISPKVVKAMGQVVIRCLSS